MSRRELRKCMGALLVASTIPVAVTASIVMATKPSAQIVMQRAPLRVRWVDDDGNMQERWTSQGGYVGTDLEEAKEWLRMQERNPSGLPYIVRKDPGAERWAEAGRRQIRAWRQYLEEWRDERDINARKRKTIAWLLYIIAAALMLSGTFAIFLKPHDRAKSDPLTAAIRSGNVQRVQDALEKRTAKGRDEGGNPFLITAFLAFEDAGIPDASALRDIVEALLDGGADADAASPNGITPLHCAAVLGTREAASLLLLRGACVGTLSGRQQTPLELAVTWDSEGVAEELIQGGALQELDGDTILKLVECAEKQQQLRLSQLLRASIAVERGA